MTLLRAALTVGLLTTLSRLTGFARDMLMAAMLGAGVAADAFFVSFKLANCLRRLFAEGAFTALPHRVFEGERIGDAFRLMQRAGHIGKIVVRPATAASESPGTIGRFAADAEGLHIVFGGTSGFGLATAAWLAGRGARRLVLASLSGQPAPPAAAAIEALRVRGVEVRLAAVEIELRRRRFGRFSVRSLAIAINLSQQVR